MTTARSPEASEVRRRLEALHSELRSAGLNPIEALGSLADRLENGLGVSKGELSLETEVSAAELVSVIYQVFMASGSRNGLGQYFTPQPVAEFVGEMVAQLSGEDAGTAFDPFCGTGLLLETLWQADARWTLVGIDINQSVAKLAKTVGALGPVPLDITVADAFVAWLGNALPEADAVVTNPPFGAFVSSIDRQDPRIPESLRRMRSIPAELLGLELSIDSLRPGGVLGIVLPQSVVTNSTWSKYRAHAFGRLELVGLVSLPEETFSPFQGVARSCVLLARKASVGFPQRFKYLRSTSVGYDSTGREIDSASDLDAIKASLSASSGPEAEISESGVITLPIFGADGEGHRLGDIADVFTGKTIAKSKFTTEGPRVLKVGDLSGSMISWLERANGRVSEAWFDKHKRWALRIGDICLTAAAHRPRYIGLKVDMVDEIPPEGAIPSAEVLVIRMRQDSPVRPEILLHYLRSQRGYASIQSLVRGSTAHLYPKDVMELRVPRLERLNQSDAIVTAFWDTARSFRQYLSDNARTSQLYAQAELEMGDREDR